MRIVYFDIDSLRPDHLGCYGYRRPTSPHIDALARRGVTLGQVYASDVPCLPSRTGFFGGRFGTCSGVVNHGGVCSDLPPEGGDRGFRSLLAENSLASLLVRQGYRTASISPFPRRHSAYQMTWGFHETFDTGKGGLENADEMFEPAADWLRRNGQSDNWFLHINMWDPHTPYDTPESFGNPFASEPVDSWLTQEIVDRQRSSYGPHSAREVPDLTDDLPARWRWGVGEIKDLADAKTHLDGYDAGVRYADMYLGRLLDILAEQGVFEETAILVSADHGENLGELNVWGDHQTADEFTCHIPAVLVWPGVTEAFAGTKRDGLAYHLDLAATLVDLAGPQGASLLESAAWMGRSLRGLISGEESGRDELFLSQGAWSLQRSLRWDNWLLIHTTHTGLKDFPETMLFDLEADPHETQNVARERPDLVVSGTEKIRHEFRQMSARCPLGDPFEVVLAEGGPLHANERSAGWARYVQRLRDTGREVHAQWLDEDGGCPRPAELSIYG